MIALADMDLYRFFVPRRLSIRWVREAFAAHDFILFDANLPEETIAAIVAKAHSLAKPVAAIAISLSQGRQAETLHRGYRLPVPE